mmetsp:Transcript_95050/g.268599  ORF Transcript_95050/g.268599 Transcript_95050/m.268599 type:complete len:240 (-) Transcript_95050:392-1111(-)
MRTCSCSRRMPGDADLARGGVRAGAGHGGRRARTSRRVEHDELRHDAQRTIRVHPGDALSRPHRGGAPAYAPLDGDCREIRRGLPFGRGHHRLRDAGTRLHVQALLRREANLLWHDGEHLRVAVPQEDVHRLVLACRTRCTHDAKPRKQTDWQAKPQNQRDWQFDRHRKAENGLRARLRASQCGRLPAGVVGRSVDGLGKSQEASSTYRKSGSCCQKCGEVRKADFKFCVFCGKPLQGE